MRLAWLLAWLALLVDSERQVYPVHNPPIHVGRTLLVSASEGALHSEHPGLLGEGVGRTKSCRQLGWTSPEKDKDKVSHNVCGSASGVAGGCAAASTWETAKNVCSMSGGRLCTAEEIEAGVVQGTGCGVDSKRVWTTSICGEDMVETLGGGNASQLARSCTDKHAGGVFVGCCADSRGESESELCVQSRKEEQQVLEREAEAKVRKVGLKMERLEADLKILNEKLRQKNKAVAELSMSRAEAGLSAKRQLELEAELAKELARLQAEYRARARAKKMLEGNRVELKMAERWSVRYREMAVMENDAVAPVEKTLRDQRNLLTSMLENDLGSTESREMVRREMVELGWQISDTARAIQKKEVHRYRAQDVRAATQAAAAFQKAIDAIKVKISRLEQQVDAARIGAREANDAAARMTLWHKVRQIGGSLDVERQTLTELQGRQYYANQTRFLVQAEIDSKPESEALAKPYEVQLGQLRKASEEASVETTPGVMMSVLGVKGAIRWIERDTARAARVEAQRETIIRQESFVAAHAEALAARFAPIEKEQADVIQQCATRQLRVLKEVVAAVKRPFEEMELKKEIDKDQQELELSTWKQQLKEQTATLDGMIGKQDTLEDVATARKLAESVQTLQQRIKLVGMEHAEGTLGGFKVKLAEMQREEARIRNRAAHHNVFRFPIDEVDVSDLPPHLLQRPQDVTLEDVGEATLCADWSDERQDVAERLHRLRAEMQEQQALGAELLFSTSELDLQDAVQRQEAKLRKAECKAVSGKSSAIKQSVARMQARSMDELRRLGEGSKGRMRALMNWAMRRGGPDGMAYFLIRSQMRKLARDSQTTLAMLGAGLVEDIQTGTDREWQLELSRAILRDSVVVKRDAVGRVLRARRNARVLHHKLKLSRPEARPGLLKKIQENQVMEQEAKTRIANTRQSVYLARKRIQVLSNWRLVSRASRMALEEALKPARDKLKELSVERLKSTIGSREYDGLSNQIDDLRNKLQTIQTNAKSDVVNQVEELTQGELAAAEMKLQRAEQHATKIQARIQALVAFAKEHGVEVSASGGEDMLLTASERSLGDTKAVEPSPKVKRKLEVLSYLVKERAVRKAKAEEGRKVLEFLKEEAKAAAKARSRIDSMQNMIQSMNDQMSDDLEKEVANLEKKKQQGERLALRQKLWEEQKRVERGLYEEQAKADLEKAKAEHGVMAEVEKLAERASLATEAKIQEERELKAAREQLQEATAATNEVARRVKAQKRSALDVEESASELKSEIHRTPQGEEGTKQADALRLRLAEAVETLNVTQQGIASLQERQAVRQHAVDVLHERVGNITWNLSLVSTQIVELIQQKGATLQGLEELIKQRAARARNRMQEAAGKLEATHAALNDTQTKLEECQNSPRQGDEEPDCLDFEFAEKGNKLDIADATTRLGAAKRTFSIAHKDVVTTRQRAVIAQGELELAQSESRSAQADVMISKAAIKQKELDASARKVVAAEEEELRRKREKEALAEESRELVAKQKARDDRVKEKQREAKRIQEHLEEGERELARKGQAKIAADKLVAEKHALVMQLREELASCSLPQLNPVNCDDLREKLGPMEQELAAAKAQAHQAALSFKKHELVYKQQQQAANKAGVAIQENVSIARKVKASADKVRQQTAKAERRLARVVAERREAVKAQAAASAEAEAASESAKLAIASANATGACAAMKREQRQRPVNTVALDQATAECKKAKRVLIAAQRAQVIHGSLVAAEAKKVAAAQEVQQAEEKARTLQAAMQEIERQLAFAELEVKSCMSSSNEGDKCKALVAKVKEMKQAAQAQKLELEQAVAVVAKKKENLDEVAKTVEKAKGKAKAAKARHESLVKGKKSAAVFEAKRAKEAVSEASSQVETAKKAARAARKMEAAKKEKAKALLRKLDACQKKAGGGANAECEAIQEEVKNAQQELKETQKKLKIAEEAVEEASEALQKAEEEAEEAEDQLDVDSDEEDEVDDEMMVDELLEQKQFGTLDAHGLFVVLKRNVTSRHFEDRIKADTDLYESQYEESETTIQNLDQKLAILESRTDEEVAAAAHAMADEVAAKKKEVASNGDMIDVLEHEVAQRNHQLRDLENKLTAGTEHSRLRLRKARALELLVQAAGARQAAHWARYLAQEVEGTKHEVELTAQFGNPEMKEKLDDEAADLERKRAGLAEQAARSEAVAAGKEAEASTIRKGVSELMSAWQGAIEAAFPALFEALDMKQAMANSTANSSSTEIGAKLEEVSEAVKLHMATLLKRSPPQVRQPSEEYMLPVMANGTVEEMAAALDRKAVQVDAYRLHRKLQAAIQRVDHAELLATLERKHAKHLRVVKEARALRLALAEPKALLEQALKTVTTLGIQRSVKPKILQLDSKINEAAALEDSARKREVGIMRQIRELGSPGDPDAPTNLERREETLSQLRHQVNACSDPSSAFCKSITQEYEHERRKVWMLQRELVLEDDLNRCEREQRAAASAAAASQEDYQSLSARLEEARKAAANRPQPSDRDTLLKLEARSKIAEAEMWGSLKAAANATTRVQRAHAALHAMKAVFQVKSAAAEQLQQRMFELEHQDPGAANKKEIDGLLSQLSQLSSLADDAYRSMVERKEHAEAKLPTDPRAQQLHQEILGLYERADTATSEDLRSRYRDYARLKRDEIQALEHNRTGHRELSEMKEQQAKVVAELHHDMERSKRAQEQVSALQRQLQGRVAKIQKKAMVSSRDSVLLRKKQGAIKQDANTALELLRNLVEKKQRQDVKADMVEGPMWVQIGMVHEQQAQAGAPIAKHLDQVNAVLDKLRAQEALILRPTQIVVETLMVPTHQAHAKLARDAATKSAGELKMLQRKVQELDATIRAERESSGLPAEAMEAALADLTAELGDDSVKLGRVEEVAWLAAAHADWMDETHVRQFSQLANEKQQALEDALSATDDEIYDTARQVSEALAGGWMQTTVERVQEGVRAATDIIRVAQAKLAPWSLGIAPPTTTAPTSAPTASANLTVEIEKSPLEWEAKMHADDTTHVESIKHEVEEHLKIATAVARPRGVEPPTAEDAEADALKRATKEATEVAVVHGNGLDPERLPLLSKVGVPPPPEVEPPEPEVSPPPPDEVEVQAAKVERAAKHVEATNSELATITKLAAPEDPIEYMRHEAKVDELQKTLREETEHLMADKQLLADMEGSKELADARKRMKTAKVKADAYRRQYTEYVSADPINKYAVKRVESKLHKAGAEFEDAKTAYVDEITRKRVELKAGIRKENEIVEELELEMKETIAVGNKKLAGEQKAVVDKMSTELARKKRELERVNAMAKLVGAPESPPGMYYWPTAEEQQVLEVKAADAIHAQMQSRVEALQDRKETKEQKESAVEEADPSKGDGNDSQWERVKQKLARVFQQQLAHMMDKLQV